MSQFPNISQDTPIYQLLAPAFLDNDTWYPEGMEIAYEGPPNEHMAPMNEAARVRMQAMLDHLDECAREQAQLVGRPYKGRLTDLGELIAQASQDAKVLQQREQAEVVKRAMPQPLTDTPAPGLPTMKPLAIRKQEADAKSSVKAFGAPVAKGRATEVLHKMGQDRLTEKAPIQG